MSVPLTPLTCDACGAPVPLPVELGTRAETACQHCHATVPIGAEYAAAIRAVAATAEARRATEPLWQALSAPPPWWLAGLALALVVLLPVIATLFASLLPHPPLGRIEIYALVTVPALAPGAALYLWTAAIEATSLRLRDALGAHPPAADGGAPSCRQCGAPVSLPPDSIAATCAYCGTDNLVAEVPRRGLQRRLRAAIRTLDQAVRLLRTRRLVLGLGAIAITAAVAGTSLLLGSAMGI